MKDGSYAFLTGFTTVYATASHELDPRARYTSHKLIELEDAYSRTLGLTPPTDSRHGDEWAKRTTAMTEPLLHELQPELTLGRGVGALWAGARAKGRGGDARVSANYLALARATLASLDSPAAARFLRQVEWVDRPYSGPMDNNDDKLLDDPDLHEALSQPPEGPPPHAVLANPGDPACSLEQDNTARLAYADELVAIDPTRAGFIRVQVRNDRSFDKLVNRLSRWHGGRWSQLGQLAQSSSFGRGFADRITIDVAAFLEHASEIYRRAPITGVTFTGVNPDNLVQLAASPHLARLRFVGIVEQGLTDAHVALLVNSPHVERLVAIDLSRNALTSAGVYQLPRLASLRAVRLVGNPGDPTPFDVADSSGGVIGVDYPSSWHGLQGQGLAWIEPGAATVDDPFW